MWIRLIGAPAEVRDGLARLHLIYPDGDYSRGITAARRRGHVRAYVEVASREPANLSALTDKPEGPPGLLPEGP